MAKLIRKISVGKDYKNDAMHYAVGQEVYGGCLLYTSPSPRDS